MNKVKRIVSILLAVIMTASMSVTALSVSAAETTVDGLTVTKISYPEAGEREVDGLIAGGDRENSYTWRLAMRGDEIYIATTRNIASALVNMYGGEFAAAGIDLDTFWSMIDVVTNGDIPRNDANEGANCPAFLETEEGLYLGTCNPFYGGQLYLIHDDNAMINPEDPTDPENPNEPYPVDMPTWYKLGDADDDREITILDATTIQRYLVRNISEDYIDFIAGDVTKDGLDITDATFIQRYLASMEIPHPVGEMFNRDTGDATETIEETVLLDKGGIKVTAKSFDRGFVPYLTISIENNSQKGVGVTFDSVAVNGYETTGDFSVKEEDRDTYTSVTNVAAGESVELPFEFNSYDVLEDNRFSVFADIAFVTSVIDPDRYDTLDAEKASVKTSAYNGYEYNYDESGQVIYDKNGIKIVVKSETSGVYEMPQLYISNQSDKDIAVNTPSCMINGTETGCNIGGNVYSGNRTIREMYFFDPVEEGSELEFSLTIYELNTRGVGTQLDVTDTFHMAI